MMGLAAASHAWNHMVACGGHTHHSYTELPLVKARDMRVKALAVRKAGKFE